MNPFEHMQSLAELWSKSGQAFVTAQKSMFPGMPGSIPGVSGSGENMSSQAVAPDTEEFEAARRDFSSLWSSAAELSTAFQKGLKGSGGANPLAEEMLGKIFDPRGWFSATNDVDQSLQRMAEGPQFADMWNVERKFATVFNAWVAMRRESLAHNTVVLEAWLKAARGFAKTLNERADKGETFKTSREVLTMWIETANESLLETQRSEAFLKTQRDLLKASTDLRLAQQELAEFYSEMFGYPSRAELDDVHKAVTELRRELRAFKRQNRAPHLVESTERSNPKTSGRSPASASRQQTPRATKTGASS